MSNEGGDMVVKDEPRRRRDNKCAVCRKPIRKVKPQKGVPPQLYASDPFCSATCARAYYGTEIKAKPDVVEEPDVTA